jgi:hypothetical protein
VSEKGAAEVFIDRHPVRFPSLPRWVKEGLTRGRDRVEHLCDEIAAASPVHWMPPVRILDVGWRSTEGCIYGRATPLRIGAHTYMGVELPATTVIFADDEVLRAILVHEFTHNFWYYCQMVQSLARGETGMKFTIDPENSEDDASHMVDPKAWFGQGDAERFLFQHDSRLDALNEAIVDKWVVEYGLPLEHGAKRFQAKSLTAPAHVLAHARKVMGVAAE